MNSLQVVKASVCIQQQLCALSKEDSKSVIREECQVAEFLSSVSRHVIIAAYTLMIDGDWGPGGITSLYLTAGDLL